MGHARGHDAEHPDSRIGGKYYKWYILWLTFPAVIMLFIGQPFALILAYGVLGACFMPFLAVILLWILNTDRTFAEWRNKLPSNIALVICALAFAALAANELWKLV